MTFVFFLQFLFFCCSFTKSCPILCDPMNCSMPASSVFHIFRSLLKFMSTESVMLSNHLILCHHLLLLPSVFPIIRVFSSKWALYIRWLKYWSFSFSISPSSEYSELIFFRIDCCDHYWPDQCSCSTLDLMNQHLQGGIQIEA